MDNFIINLLPLVNTIFDRPSMFLSSLSDGGLLWTVGSGFAVALAMVLSGNITDLVKENLSQTLFKT
ncbi:MAG: hypothetical protein LBQ50_06370 [Planctomycetaceae bacterium]|jgi:hypothetical protein|nr:hypothetical protein [Planctomycetaceae bacterium]